MKTGRGWWALAGVVAGSVALLLGGYVAAYFWLVEPLTTHVWIVHMGSETPVVHSRVSVKYRYADRHGSFPPIFFPIHRLDREWIRPRAWKDDRDPAFIPENSN